MARAVDTKVTITMAFAIDDELRDNLDIDPEESPSDQCAELASQMQDGNVNWDDIFDNCRNLVVKVEKA